MCVVFYQTEADALVELRSAPITTPPSRFLPARARALNGALWDGWRSMAEQVHDEPNKFS